MARNRVKSSSDIDAQYKRIAQESFRRARQNPYPSSEFTRQHARVNKARDIASRYQINIRKKQRKLAGEYSRLQKQGDHEGSERVRTKAYNTKYSRSTYMGLTVG